jgi:hypothetical protein
VGASGNGFGLAGTGKRAKRNDDHRERTKPRGEKERKAQKSAIVRYFPQWSAALLYLRSSPASLFYPIFALYDYTPSSDHQAKGSENEHSPNLLPMRLEVSVSRRRERWKNNPTVSHWCYMKYGRWWSPTLIHRHSCQQTQKFNYYFYSFDVVKRILLTSDARGELGKWLPTHITLKKRPWEINSLTGRANHFDGTII